MVSACLQYQSMDQLWESPPVGKEPELSSNGVLEDNEAFLSGNTVDRLSSTCGACSMCTCMVYKISHLKRVQEKVRLRGIPDDVFDVDLSYDSKCRRCTDCEDCKVRTSLTPKSVLEEKEKKLIEDAIFLDYVKRRVVSKIPFIQSPGEMLQYWRKRKIVREGENSNYHQALAELNSQCKKNSYQNEMIVKFF